MWKLIIAVLIVLFIAVLIMCLSSRLTSRKTFPEHRIGHNKEMKKRKIPCAVSQDKIARSKSKKAKQYQ